jgi:enoyl-[acyl-carrier protein] reductase II
MIKTALTDMFGIEYPILLAGMGHTALPHMVAAVSNAGGLGVLGAGSTPPDEVRRQIREVRTLTDRPFGINAPLALPNGKENAVVGLEEEVPYINYSMGKGDWIVKAAHHYGGKVSASVTSVKLALSAQKQGADAVVATGYEAAGHSGDVGTFVLIPRLAEVLDIPVIAAGGCATGGQLAALIAMGGAGVSMGTRFVTTQESPWHQNFKDLAVGYDIHDTVISDKFDGIPLRKLASERALQIVNSRLNPFRSFLDSFEVAREVDIPYPKLFWDVIRKGPAETIKMMRMAQMLGEQKYGFAGDTRRAAVGGGQSVGLVHDLPTIAEVMKQIVAETHEAQSRLAGAVGGAVDVDTARRKSAAPAA